MQTKQLKYCWYLLWYNFNYIWFMDNRNLCFIPILKEKMTKFWHLVLFISLTLKYLSTSLLTLYLQFQNLRNAGVIIRGKMVCTLVAGLDKLCMCVHGTLKIKIFTNCHTWLIFQQVHMLRNTLVQFP